MVISDALQDWPLFSMGREASLEHFAELQGITRHGDYVKKTFSTDRDFRSTSMADFIASLDTPAKPGETPAYMGNNIVPEKLLALIRYPQYFAREKFIAPRIWIGPKGTLTPLHRDDTDNLFAQVWGQKSFILAAPHHRPATGTGRPAPRAARTAATSTPTPRTTSVSRRHAKCLSCALCCRLVTCCSCPKGGSTSGVCDHLAVGELLGELRARLVAGIAVGTAPTGRLALSHR